MKFAINLETNIMYLIISSAVNAKNFPVSILRNLANPEKELLTEPQSILESEKYKLIDSSTIVEAIKKYSL